MYREYFGLKENPFSIAPDPHYFFMSEGHREALAHLVYGVERDGGFILLTGEVGTGKTTVCRCLLERMPEDADIAFILNPRLTAPELLASICDEFGIPYPEGNGSIKVLVSRIYDYLLEAHSKGRRAILIIEEAQNLTVDVLEQIRLLTNLETSQRKLLQIIMLGQPELRRMLSRSELRQLSQRITARYHLGPLLKEEVPEYVAHRLSVAGLVRGRPFPDATLSLLYRLTGGVPRLINVVCDRALTGAYVQGREAVDKKTLSTAAREVSGETASWWRKRVSRYVSLGALVVLCAGGGGYYYGFGPGHVPRSAPPARVAAALASAGNPAKSVPLPAVAALTKPAGVSRAETREKAYQALFRAWGVTYDPGDRRSPSQQALRHDLRSVGGNESLATLKMVNRPALLLLTDPLEGEYYATVTALSGDRATVAVGKETRVVSAEELMAQWSGTCFILWRPPEGYDGKLGPGSRGQAVVWLEKHLASVSGGRWEPRRPGVYDKEMAVQVRRFQASSGLDEDGVAGWKTIVRLADRSGEAGPSLAPAKGGG